MIWSALAFAGTLSLDDRLGLLDELDQRRLREESAGLPFDVHVHLSAEDLPALKAEAARVRSQRRQLILAIDPEHRQTWVEVGPGMRLDPSEYPEVADAGKGAFRQKRWADGILAMILRAATPDPKAARVETVVEAEPVAPAAPTPWLSWLGAGLATLAALGALRRA